jgi:hypothetical protein
MIVRKLILISTVALGLTGCLNTTENQKSAVSSPVFKKVPSSQSQITFNNVVDENYRHNYFDTFAYVYNGAGVATGDFNNDGLMDVYFTGN